MAILPKAAGRPEHALRAFIENNGPDGALFARFL
jgi:hypothetical protein